MNPAVARRAAETRRPGRQGPHLRHPPARPSGPGPRHHPGTRLPRQKHHPHRHRRRSPLEELRSGRSQQLTGPVATAEQIRSQPPGGSAAGQGHEEPGLRVVPPRTHPGYRNEGGQGPAPTHHTTRRQARNQRRQLLNPLLQHGWICNSFKHPVHSVEVRVAPRRPRIDRHHAGSRTGQHVGRMEITVHESHRPTGRKSQSCRSGLAKHPPRPSGSGSQTAPIRLAI